MPRFGIVAESGKYFCSDAQASHCGGLSCRGAQALGAWALVAAVRRFIRCGSQALEHLVVVAHGLPLL